MSESSKCDIVFMAKGRPEFTAASMAALMDHTNWERVSSLVFIAAEIPARMGIRVTIKFLSDEGGPVANMRAYLSCDPAPLWAKIDNDVIVPPGWLDASLDTMDAHEELDLLGIEPPLSRTPAPWAGGVRVPAPELSATGRYAACKAIGGIGLFRTRAWKGRAPMKPFATYGGFTNWQTENPDLKIGWIAPPLKLFLLDRLPMEPWASLSKRYIADGQQRPWTNYTEAEARELAGWWLSPEA